MAAAHGKLDAFTETGADVFSLSAQSAEFSQVHGLANVRFQRVFEMGDGSALLPLLDVGYMRELGDMMASTTGAFAANPGSRILLTSAANGQDALRLGAGLTYRLQGGLTMFARGQIDAQRNVNSRSGLAGLSYRF